MFAAKHMLRRILYMLFMVLLAGCAVQSTNTSSNIYYPMILPGKTLNNAVSDLLNTLCDGKRVWVDLDGQQQQALGGSSVAVKCNIYNNKIELLKQTENRLITSFYFFSLMGKNIVAQAPAWNDPAYIVLPGLVKLRFSQMQDAKKVADALFFIQQEVRAYRMRLEKQLAEFEPLAAQYRALAVKPKMTEEQRKLIVQANALTEQKEYFKARDKYRKALESDPTFYPPAYYNLALLDAQMNLPFSAILYMKHYLLLAPNPQDTRTAKDKIYEWELLMPAEHPPANAGLHARGYLGVRIESLSEKTAASVGLQDGKGARVLEVMVGSPAQQGGIQVGDIIHTIDGKPIEATADLLAIVAATPVGKTVAVGIRRADQAQTLTITIAKMPE